MSYSDKDFEVVLNEARNVDLSEWEFFVETQGVKIYRLFKEKSKLFEYKVIGDISVDAELLAAVYMDLQYRRTWDSYVRELTSIQKSDPEIIYWEVAYPWPLANRDYLYMRQLKNQNVDGKYTWTILARSVNPDELSDNLRVDEKRGVVRVTDYIQSLVIFENGKGACKIYMHYYDDPKGNIPTMIINWAAKTGVPGFLTTLKKACQNYSKSVSN